MRVSFFFSVPCVLSHLLLGSVLGFSDEAALHKQMDELRLTVPRGRWVCITPSPVAIARVQHVLTRVDTRVDTASRSQAG